MNTVLKSVIISVAMASATLAYPAQAGSLDDETIFAIFDQANMADIATGRLGWKKSQNKKVRALAKMVVTDHTAVQQMGRDIAAKYKMMGTPPANDQSWIRQAEALKNLSALDGKAFDEAYLRHEIAYHAAVIKAINSTLLPAIKNEDFKQLVIKVLPGFQHHLAATQKTADQLGISY